MFGGSKSGDQTLQIASKVDLQIDDKEDSISERSWRGFWRIGTKFGSQDGPQNPHLAAKINPRPPNLEPRWAEDLQLAAKMASWTDFL